jgi:hypothetical protein
MIIPFNDETEALIRRVIWFEDPETAVKDTARFLAYAMTYATPPDMNIIRRFISNEDFRSLLPQIPPGIVDPRSWAYWHIKMGIYPPPPLPQRHIPTVFV